MTYVPGSNNPGRIAHQVWTDWWRLDLTALACKAGRRELLSHELEDKELKV